MNFSPILENVRQYYSQKIERHGAIAQGVDWNSTASQELRFAQLLKACDRTRPFSINDYGCGYGALVKYLSEHEYRFDYRGFDVSEQMIIKANEMYGHHKNCAFFTKESSLSLADYTLASGIFNVKLKSDNEEWLVYLLHTLKNIAKLSKKGFAFNVLTKYSEQHLMRPNLYYADPCFLFDHCKTNFSRQVALLHDYELYEFTILVRI